MQKYTLIGCPLGHSMSPMIHERLFALSGRDASYTLTEVRPENLGEWAGNDLKALSGINITIPHKVDIIPMLDELDITARRYNSCNCVANRDGKLIGYNTDCIGFLRSVEQMPLNGKVLLIGCGGVGRMMAMEAVLHGADLSIREFDMEKANALKTELEAAVPGAKVRILDAEPTEESFDLMLNATPVGMYPKTSRCPVSDAMIANCANVYDVIYNPVETELVRKAKALGKPAAGGAAMLVWQAVQAHEIWDGDTYTNEQVEAIVEELKAIVTRDFPIEEDAK